MHGDTHSYQKQDKQECQAGVTAAPLTQRGRHVPPLLFTTALRTMTSGLHRPSEKRSSGPWASPNIRAFVDPQDPTRVAGLMDVAAMDVAMGAMHSKRWQMPWSTTGCWARPWSSWSRSRPLGARLLSNFGAGARAERELLREAPAVPEARRAYHVGCRHLPGTGRPMPM
jgi:hypothetical protein